MLTVLFSGDCHTGREWSFSYSDCSNSTGVVVKWVKGVNVPFSRWIHSEPLEFIPTLLFSTVNSVVADNSIVMLRRWSTPGKQETSGRDLTIRDIKWRTGRSCGIVSCKLQEHDSSLHIYTAFWQLNHERRREWSNSNWRLSSYSAVVGVVRV